MIRLAIAFTLMTTCAAAQSVKLEATEIEILLSGNTAVGEWDGVAYRQFFGEDGVTIFAPEGASPTRGEWRVDAEQDEYQSVWPPADDWEGWLVMEYAGDWYWVSRTTPPTPFQVLEGEQLLPQ